MAEEVSFDQRSFGYVLINFYPSPYVPIVVTPHAGTFLMDAPRLIFSFRRGGVAVTEDDSEQNRVAVGREWEDGGADECHSLSVVYNNYEHLRRGHFRCERKAEGR